MKKIILPVIFIISLLVGYLILLGNRPAPANSDTAHSHPRQGGTLIIGIPRDVDTFNPLFSETVYAQEIGHLMLLGLADLNAQSEFEPELATRWEQSDEYHTLTYHLRKGARWQDGVPITAEDVKFTFDLIMDSVVASPARDMAEFISQVTVVDSYTVQFHFKKAYPYEIFDTAGEILPKHLLKQADRRNLRTHKIGRMPLASGPFKLKKWVSQQYIELVPNENYFGDEPYLARVIFKIIPDNTNLLTQLKTGEIDMVIGVPPGEAPELQAANPNIRLYPVSGRLYYYTAWNESFPPFSSVPVRRALTMSIDREKIIKALLNGYGKACVGHIPPMISWAYNDTLHPLPYSPQKAREILAKAGWQDHNGDGWLDKNGRRFQFVLKTDASNPIKADLAVVMQEQLRQVGIKMDIQLEEWTALLKDLKEKKFQAYIGGWNTSLFIDPTPIFHSSATNWFNYTGYANPRVDALIEAGREELNRNKAANIWKELQVRVYYDQPYTFLFWIDRIVAVDSRFRNVTPIPLSSLYNLEKWYEAAPEKQISKR